MRLPTPNLIARSRFLAITLSEMANLLTRSRADGYFWIKQDDSTTKDFKMQYTIENLKTKGKE